MKAEDVRNEEKRAIILGTIACVLLFLVCCIGTRPNTKLATEEEIFIANELYRQSGNTFAPEITIEPTKTPTAEPTVEPYISLGTFKLTAYCPCEYCCGKSNGITASETQAVEGRTIATDTDLLPFGTSVLINGHEYIVEDCGGCVKGNHIDVFMENHEAAVVFGVQYAEVYVRNE